MITTENFLITSEESGLRLDTYLRGRFPDYSRTYFQYLIEEGSVLVNGKSAKKRVLLEEDDEIEVCFLLTPEISLEPENIPLDILYEDEHILVINKPSGMVVHPAPGHPNGTFVNALLHHCAALQTEKADLRPGIVHRLDKDTSGVLVAAKHPLAHRKLVEMFSSRQIQKTYVAVCLGNPGEVTIDAPIGRHPHIRTQMAVNSEKGKPAITICKPLSPCIDGLTVVELQLITGRTHQLRVHLQHRGTPILGDPIYGAPSINKQWGVYSQLLHAAKISFSHPITNHPLLLEAPLSERMFLLKSRLISFF